MKYVGSERKGERDNKEIVETGRDVQDCQSLDSSGSVLSTFVDSIELRGNNRDRKNKKASKDKVEPGLWSENNV